MMISQKTRRTREFTGPTPHSVAILAPPTNKRPPEYLILERRKQEEQLQKNREMTNYMKQNDLKNEWERNTDSKIQMNTIRRRVNTLLKAHEFSIEDRRERLRALLQSEERNYIHEIADKEETVLERQAKMRQKAKALKEKREAERLQYVQEKYDEQFRNQCEELRSTLSKRHQDQVAAERIEQLRVKEEMQHDKERQEALYAQMWEKDRLEKAKKEEEAAKEAHRRYNETLEVLRMQIAAAKEQKKEAERLREEEAALLKEQEAMRKLEEQRALEEKIQRQKDKQAALDQSLKLKMKKKAKEQQEQLAFDLKMLEQLLEQSRNEAMEKEQRKKELKEEDIVYRQYLKKLYEAEKKKEEELEKFIQSEVEKQWQKRLDQWEREKVARKKLLDEVLAVRQEQVRDRLAENEIKQLDAAREEEFLKQKIRENQELERQRVAEKEEKFRQHQQDLRGQIAYNKYLREQEELRVHEETRLCQQAEREYRMKLKEILDDPKDKKIHPMRRAMLKTPDLFG